MLEGVNLQRVLTSPLLASEGFRHAFFTRHGGVSQGPYATLNFSVSVGDDLPCVERNLDLAAERLEVARKKLYFLSQVHGVNVRSLAGDELWDDVTHLQGDALISRHSGVACGVRTADCVPVLIADRRSGAVGAIHAGWRGAAAGIVRCTVDALRSSLPEAPSWIAAIGPHISADAFEIGEEVAVQLEAAAPGLPVVARAPGKKPHGDLRRLVAWQLAQLGVEHTDHVDGCTYLEPDRFFSFRRDGARSGRHLSAIVPRGAG